MTLRRCAFLSAAAPLLACAVAATPLVSRPRQGVAIAAKSTETKRTVKHDGVSLTFDTALAPEVRAATAPASPLQEESDKPDGVWPAHTLFTLHKTPGEAFEPDKYYPSVRACPVDDYRRAFSVSRHYVGLMDDALGELRALLRKRSRSLARKVPTLPFPDATDAFHAHVRYLRFARGSGVAYLTQSQQEPSLINNEQMSYEFRGLTDDGRYYVYASFPVAAPFLPADHDSSMTHDGYTLRQFIRDYGKRNENARNARAYDAYVARIKARLERLPPDRFTPSLRLLDEMLGSLVINK